MNLIRVIPVFLICMSSALEPKFCKNCKHFMPSPRDIKFSKCELFPKLQEDTFEFIDNTVEHYYCSITRNYNHMCGKKANKFEEHD